MLGNESFYGNFFLPDRSHVFLTNINAIEKGKLQWDL